MFVASNSRWLWSLSAVFTLAVSLIAVDASAHARWLPDGTTPGRNNNANIKSGPCGVARTNTPAVFKAGETITLQWESTIHHKGYFRIAFSPAGDAGFDQHVLLDNIQEFDNRYTGEYSAQVTLPSEPCDDCTLQMIQVMLDRNPPTNYYSCADIQLVADTASDSIPPAPVSHFEEARGLPDLRVRWTNPSEDFAGVVVLHTPYSSNLPAASGTPLPGTAYQQGDAIDSSRVVYVGSAQAVDVAAIASGDQLHVYAFDMAYNYSAAASLSVKPQEVELIEPPLVTLIPEQIGQPSASMVYAADGLLLVQANVVAGEPNGNIYTQWSVGPSLQTFVAEEAFQVTLDPVNHADEDVQLEIVVTDSLNPPNVVSQSFDFRVHSGSYYKYRLVLMQEGQVVSTVNANNGPAEARIMFTGETPANAASWTTNWQHDIPNAIEEPMVLRFTPTASASYSVSAQVFTPTAQAGPEEAITVKVSKPVKLGALSGLMAMMLPLLLLVQLWLRRRVRLQGVA